MKMSFNMTSVRVYFGKARGFWQFVCIVLLLIVSLSHCNEEYAAEFVRLYGSNNETSAVWEAVRNVSSDTNKLKSIALQVHKRAYPVMHVPPELVETIVLETNRTLRISNETMASLRLDTIHYTIPNITLIHFFLCKGLAPDCVFFLLKEEVFDTDPQVMHLNWHYCNITI